MADAIEATIDEAVIEPVTATADLITVSNLLIPITNVAPNI